METLPQQESEQYDANAHIRMEHLSDSEDNVKTAYKRVTTYQGSKSESTREKIHYTTEPSDESQQQRNRK